VSPMGDRCCTYARTHVVLIRTYTYILCTYIYIIRMIYPSRSHQISYLLSLDNGSPRSLLNYVARIVFFLLPPVLQPSSFLSPLVRNILIAIARAAQHAMYYNLYERRCSFGIAVETTPFYYNNNTVRTHECAYIKICMFVLLLLFFFLHLSPIFFNSVADV
jgi:hypothetical protein